MSFSDIFSTVKYFPDNGIYNYNYYFLEQFFKYDEFELKI